MKPYSSRNLIASTIRKSEEVNLRQLDQENKKEFDVAKSAEIQSWLRNEAVTAALRSQYHHRDIMKMRSVLRYRESGKPKARLVIIRFRRPNRGTCCITSWKKSVLHGHRSQPVLHCKKETSRTRFLQGTFDDTTHGEFAAEPVHEFRKALNLREDDIVMLTKACCSLIDAPRRWWKSLVRDTQQLGWRSCGREPCLMTWHVRSKLKGLICFHVNDVMMSGPNNDLEFNRMMDMSLQQPCNLAPEPEAQEQPRLVNQTTQVCLFAES